MTRTAHADQPGDVVRLAIVVDQVQVMALGGDVLAPVELGPAHVAYAFEDPLAQLAELAGAGDPA
jgi:hypothetical protein